MAIEIISQPEEISFSRNPQWWGFKTDNLYSNIGVKPAVILDFPVGPLVNDNTFELTYNGNTQAFIVKDDPDESGLQILSGKSHPVLADMTILEWCNSLISFFLSNFLISRDFEISLELGGVNPRVLFVAKKEDPIYDLSINTQSFVNLSIVASGINKARQPNFALIFELLISNDDHSGFDVVMKNIPLDVDDQGEAYTNLSQTLTQALIGAKNDFEQPDPGMPAVQRNLKSCRQYYIRYAESYGSKQTVQKVYSTPVRWIMLGGTGKASENSFDIANAFFDSGAGLHKFLKQESLSKDVSLRHCEWLSFVWLQPAVALLTVHVKVYFTTGDPEDITAFAISGVEKYDKITFPSGATQLNLPALFADKIIAYYEVWLVNPSAVRVSEIRTYTLNYEYQPYTKWFSSLSSLGSYDTFQTIGKGSSQYEIISQRASITKTNAFQFKQGETLEFDSKLELKETVLTGWLRTKRELKHFRDFFLSWNKFQIRNSKAYPVMVNTKTIKELKEGESLFALEFETGYRFIEESWLEDDEDLLSPAPIDVSQFWPAVSNPDPANFDDLYYRKTQTYNRTEIDAFITNVLVIEAAHHAAQQDQIDALLLALAGKSDTTHLHDERYVKIIDLIDIIDGIGAALFYKGEFNPDYTVAPDDIEVLPGYKVNDVVDFAGTFWRSLFGVPDVEPNEAIPGTDPAKWVKLIDPKTQLSVTAADTIDWQADLIPGKTYTWAQKYGNDLPGTAGAWWNNGTTWERFEGFQLDPTYSGATLLTVAITADLYPLKINLI